MVSEVTNNSGSLEGNGLPCLLGRDVGRLQRWGCPCAVPARAERVSLSHSQLSVLREEEPGHLPPALPGGPLPDLQGKSCRAGAGGGLRGGWGAESGAVWIRGVTVPAPGRAVPTTALSLGVFLPAEAPRMCVSEFSLCTRGRMKLRSLFIL